MTDKETKEWNKAPPLHTWNGYQIKNIRYKKVNYGEI